MTKPSFRKLSHFYTEGLPTITHELIDMLTQDEDFIQLYEPLTRLVVRFFKYIFHDKAQLIEALLISVEELDDAISDEAIIHYV